MAQKSIEGAHVLLEDVFDGGELVTVRASSLRHLLDEANVAGGALLGVSLKIEWAHPEEFLVSADFLLVLALGRLLGALGAALSKSPLLLAYTGKDTLGGTVHLPLALRLVSMGLLLSLGLKQHILFNGIVALGLCGRVKAILVRYITSAQLVAGGRLKAKTVSERRAE